MEKRLFLGVLGLGAALLLGATPASAETYLKFRVSNGWQQIPTEENKSRIWVDLLKLSQALGGNVTMNKAVYVVDIGTRTIAIDPRRSVFSVKRPAPVVVGRKSKHVRAQWDNYDFEDDVVLHANRLLVPIRSLPALLGATMRYHMQTRELRFEATESSRGSGFVSLPVRSKTENQQLWISVEDVSKALTVVIYNAQAQRFSLVLPDFTILELRVGQKEVFRKDQIYRILPDPFFFLTDRLMRRWPR